MHSLKGYVLRMKKITANSIRKLFIVFVLIINCRSLSYAHGNSLIYHENIILLNDAMYRGGLCDGNVATISPTAPIYLCTGSSVTLTASAGTAYLWSTGATTASISVSVAATYSVTISYSGCPSLNTSTTVTVAPTHPSSTVFLESMGTVSTTTAITIHETNNGFDNDNLTMSGSGEIRTTNVSTGYTGASGLGNAFLTNVVGRNFIIGDINTLNYSSLQLSFGIYKSTTTGTGSDFSVSVSTDGTNYTNLTMSALPTGTGTIAWVYRTARHFES